MKYIDKLCKMFAAVDETKANEKWRDAVKRAEDSGAVGYTMTQEEFESWTNRELDADTLSIEINELLEYLDGNGLVITDPELIKEALGYRSLTPDTRLKVDNSTD